MNRGEEELTAERDKNNALVNKGTHGSNGSRFLPTTKTGGTDEHTSKFAIETTGGPDTTSFIPESLQLTGEITVTWAILSYPPRRSRCDTYEWECP